MIKLTTKVTGPNDLVIPVKCPCGREFSLNARTTAPGTKIKCDGCGANIEIAGDDMRQAQAALDGLLDAFKKLGR